jgi:hypothetical protein
VRSAARGRPRPSRRRRRARIRRRRPSHRVPRGPCRR